ncbi:MAG: hypothetical protein BZ136_06215 [Methanosphaera sp. rholeuAM74]|nr:MAG: hypothetical protein BZ136_06215 [Methanosphaera sp. rholeuAM74]
MIYTLDFRLIITTSRKPSQITRRFAQFLKHYFNATYITRGKTSFKKIQYQSRIENHLLLVINQTKGNPSSIDVYDCNSSDDAIGSIYLTLSIPQENERINVDSDSIMIINKNDLIELPSQLVTSYDVKERIKSNCIIIDDDIKNDSKACISFIDKNSADTKYYVYINGYEFK